MGVKISQLIQLPPINLNLIVIPGEYVLIKDNTYQNLPAALAGRTVHMIVRYENFNTTLLSQELRPATAGTQVIYRRTASQDEGYSLHGTFGFSEYYVFNGTLA
ncbi:hypothetical protein GST45_17820 [Serratia marcescens]|uniref:Uncharacterized protein n=2 Tax=Serratia marcescens TaxID=615 RepID=A0ABD5BHT1_SERMA|nr:hypothetical protein [Serratia marcescens]MDE5234319.1 hypothetical protein [Serratia marcescens]MDE5257514.1 hypothetical protein [Serratia marcescens]MDQ9402274.1 hypothetical protein [Serratia marcescens]MDQ9424675.1 hypothetical protein [Serratia marcescens]MDQ9433804.1 hypothetical protein [Serratia marcescens]